MIKNILISSAGYKIYEGKEDPHFLHKYNRCNLINT